MDSVLGWVYLFFNDYDYTINPLGIENKYLMKIQSINKKFKNLNMQIHLE